MFRHLRANRAGPDGKHTDAMGPYFRCNRLSESDKRGLAGGVAREICNWDGAARDVDNPALAARNHSGQNSPGMAALLTNTATGPRERSISCNALATAAASVTSAAKGLARPPDCSIVRAVSSISEAERARIAVVTPAAPSLAAMARPMPRPPPVTTATCPASSELIGVALEFIGMTRLGSALQSMDSHLPLCGGDKLF